MNTDVLENLKNDDELTQTVKDYINNECGSIEDICLAVAAISDHLLALLDPDFCGIVDYHEVWVEPSECGQELYSIIDSAFEKASL